MSSKAHPDDGFRTSNSTHSALPTFVTSWTPGHNFQGFTEGQYDSTSNLIRASNTTQSDAFVSNDTFWYNPPTHHTSQYYGPVLGGISAGHSGPFTRGSSYPPSYILPMPYLNDYAETSSSLFPSSNDSLHQWQNIFPRLAPPSMSFTSIVTPSLPLIVEFSPPHLLSCLWLLDGIPCEFTGPLEVLKSHCKSSHFSGPQNAQIKCRWEGCDYHKRDDPAVDVMRRGCMWRHISEVHLGMKRGT